MPAPDWASEPKEEPLVNPTASRPTTPTTANSDGGNSVASKNSASMNRTLWFFRFLTCLTILLALLVAGTNAYIIYDEFNSLGARGVILRIYGIFFCLLICFSEFESRGFHKYFGFFENWVARGLAIAFVGLITWNQDCGGGGDASYEDVVAYMMMGVGLVYMLLGVACMKTIKEAAQNEGAEEAPAA